MARFYGYDLEQQKLIKYNFRWQNSSNITDEIYFLPRDEDFKILPPKEFVVRAYDNNICKYKAYKWRFNSEENIFEEIDAWLEERD